MSDTPDSKQPDSPRRETRARPIGRAIHFSASERAADGPADPWWIIKLGPGMNPIEIGHDEFALLFEEVT